ncbi:FtsX-like permease family protein [Solirubrobacter pauli]|uniref:FtsX-like permease family protein n=1 Tax=Solirubrobacter pauli TaxID=166793 RepID=A0A660LGR1_9ACTN|nr:FtsX-like permease family protein [Solirubrobacter pauli]RKQ93486.1 FtsX-like permease family protein [Solirubrobacter pauli]
MLAVLGLVLARSRRRAGALLAVAVGVAAAAAVVLAAGPLTLVARDAAMGRALSEASASERALRLTVQRPGEREGGADALRTLETDVAAGFPGAGARSVRFSGRAVGRTSVVLAGVDALGTYVRLAAGRLPTRCDARVCEVVAVAGRPEAVVDLEGARLRVVGRGRLDGVPLGPLPPAPGRPDAGATFLVAGGVAPLLELEALDGLPRTFGWTRVLDASTVHPWNTDRVLTGLADVQDAFAGVIDGAQVSLPTAPIAAEARRGRAAAAFALIVAALAATILLAFAAFAAAEQHDDVAAELRRLRAMAARRRHRTTLVLGEATMPALAGVLVGATIAVAATALAASLALDGPTTTAAATIAGAPPSAGAAAGGSAVPSSVGPTAGSSAGASGVAVVLREGFFTSRALVAALVLLGAGVGVIAGVLAGAQSRGVRVALEAGCVVVLGGIVWQGASRGSVDAVALADGGAVDPVLVLAPGAAALACGLLALRLVPPLLRALARGAERLPVGPYLALVALARQPARTAAAVAVVAVAAAAGTFALGHARTLQQGALDQAAYRTAGDVRGLRPAAGSRPSADQTPVVRIKAETLGRPLAVQVVGVGAEALPRLPGWREDFSSTPIAQLAQRLDGDPDGLQLGGVELPRDVRRIELPVKLTGARAVIQLAVQRADGTFARLLGGTELPPGGYRLSAPVPRSERGGRIVALEVALGPGGSGTSDLGEVIPRALTATFADGRRAPLTDFADWMPSTAGSFTGGTFSYSIAGVVGYLGIRPQQPAAREPIPVLATPALAARVRAGGNLVLRLPGGGQSRMRIVGTVRHVPTTSPGEAMIADVGRLFAALNTQYPGLAAVSEHWRIGPAPPSGPELRRADLAAAAAADPLARGVLVALRGLAILGALVALAAVLLAVAATARDRGGEQAELEAVGVPPRTLQAQMVAGAAATALVGLLAGVVGGAALTGRFTDLVALGADGRRPLPELLPTFPWTLAGLAVAAAAVAAIVAAGGQARRAFRGDAVGRLRG